MHYRNISSVKEGDVNLSEISRDQDHGTRLVTNQGIAHKIAGMAVNSQITWSWRPITYNKHDPMRKTRLIKIV